MTEKNFFFALIFCIGYGSIASPCFNDDEISGEVGFELEKQLFGDVIRGFERKTSAFLMDRQAWFTNRTVDEFCRLVKEQLKSDLGGCARSGKFEFTIARLTRHTTTTNSMTNKLQSSTLNDDKDLYRDTKAKQSNFRFHCTGICGMHHMNMQAVTESRSYSSADAFLYESTTNPTHSLQEHPSDVDSFSPQS